MARTDIHRPGAIIPADYTYSFSYDLGGSDPHFDPPINVNLVVKMRAEGAAFVATGGLGNCSICGARHRYGDIWRYTPTGEFLHVGHDCADKYAMLADRSAYELEVGRRDRAKATMVIKAKKAQKRAEFLASEPGLETALETDHPIVADIKARFVDFCRLSEKQVELVFKLAGETYCPAKPAERHVVAPTGRVTFTGTVVSAKLYEGAYGSSVKLTVKVTTADGSWLAWMTCPSALQDAVWNSERRDLGDTTPVMIKGATVEVKATLEAGREPHFAFAKRPVAKLLALREGCAAELAA